MPTTEISKYDDVIDSRDVIARIEELQEERDTFQAGADNVARWSLYFPTEAAELAALEALAEEASGSPDWQYGETLIRDSYFKDYAQELAEDCGMLKEGQSWPNNCIDWDQAARELQMDYTSVELDGVDYWIRS